MLAVGMTAWPAVSIHLFLPRRFMLSFDFSFPGGGTNSSGVVSGKGGHPT